MDASEIWLTVADDADYDETLAGVRAAVRGYPGLRQHGEHLRRRPDDRCQCHDRGRPRGACLRRGLPDLLATAEDVQEALKTVEGVISPVVDW